MFTGEMWNGVLPLFGLVMFLLFLAWWVIESVIAGIRSVRDDRRSVD